MDGGNGAIQAVRRNLMLRTALLQTGVSQRKFLGTFLGALGQTTRIKLFNVGITTSLRILVTVPITIGTAIAVPSSRGPWNLISKLKISDYDGTDRISLSGLQLFQIASVRNRQAYGYNNQVQISAAGIIVNPSVPTAVASATLQFFLEVPIALNDKKTDGLNQDLTGAIYSQTGVGELYLSIDWNTSLYTNGSIEAVYSGAPTTTVVLNGVTGPSVLVWQNFIFPQYLQDGTLPIPPIDVSSVYELSGAIRTADNIAVNSEKLISFPNVRRVLGAYVNFVNNGAVSATDLNLLRIIVNANNILYENSQITQILEQRLLLEGDLSTGFYFWLFRDKPIETAIFGNVQLGITPNTVAGTSYFEFVFESIYTKGAALPGMVQSG
jgi:hypothetical protein